MSQPCRGTSRKSRPPRMSRQESMKPLVPPLSASGDAVRHVSFAPAAARNLQGILPCRARLFSGNAPKARPQTGIPARASPVKNASTGTCKLRRYGINPNRSLDTPSPFLIGNMRLSGILPSSVRILFPATPSADGKHAAWHKRAISPKPDDRFGIKRFRLRGERAGPRQPNLNRLQQSLPD